MRKNLLIFFLIFCLIFSGFIPTVIEAKASENQDTVKSGSKASTFHSPILISGNSDFTEENGVSSGDGTESNPYMIENWDINSSVGNGIYIQCTTAYFWIRNCSLHDGVSCNPEQWYHGILLYDAPNGMIDNCTVTNNNHGIVLDHSPNSRLINNTAHNNNASGFEIYESSNVYIKNCNALNNTNGIVLKYSSNSNTINCTTYNNTYCGIALTLASNNNSIINCGSYLNGRGIGIYYSSYNNITNCTFYSNYYGVNMGEASYGFVTNSNILNNTYGFYMGCELKENFIYHNNIINNVNNLDSYLNYNHWDNGYLDGGNYWGENYSCDMYSGRYYTLLRIHGSDGIYDGVVNVSGGVRDNYPLAQPIDISLPEIVVTDISFSGRYVWDTFYPVAGDTVGINVIIYNRDYTNISSVRLHFFNNDKLICVQVLNFSCNETAKTVFINWKTSSSSAGDHIIKVKIFSNDLTEEEKKYGTFNTTLIIHQPYLLLILERMCTIIVTLFILVCILVILYFVIKERRRSHL